MRCQCEQRNPLWSCIHRQPSADRRCVHQQRNPAFQCQRPQRLSVLHCPQVMASVMRRDENRPFRERLCDRRRLHSSFAIHLHARGLEPILLQPSHREVNRRMLNVRQHNMIPPLPLCPGHPLHRQVVRLGAAAGENDFLRVCVHHRRATCPSLLQRFPCREPISMQGTSAAELILQERPHRLPHLGSQRRACKMIEINTALHGLRVGEPPLFQKRQVG